MLPRVWRNDHGRQMGINRNLMIMKKQLFILIPFLIVFLPSIVLGADYLLKRGEYVFDSQFQMEHIISLDNETGVGYINDQLEKKTIIITAKDEIVRIIDSCSFCRANIVKVKAINGKSSGWVLKSNLMEVKIK